MLMEVLPMIEKVNAPSRISVERFPEGVDSQSEQRARDSLDLMISNRPLFLTALAFSRAITAGTMALA